MRIYELKPDPPVRDDGRCWVCGRERPERAVLERDPFCVSACARSFHGTLLADAHPARQAVPVCSGCACALDDHTLGCEKCRQRHKARARTARERAERAA